MGIFYEDRTWIPVIDKNGCNPAEVYWSGVERAAYVAYQYPITFTFVFGDKPIGKECWEFPDKTVSAFKIFSDFNEAKRWSETVIRLNKRG